MSNHSKELSSALSELKLTAAMNNCIAQSCVYEKLKKFHFNEEECEVLYQQLEDDGITVIDDRETGEEPENDDLFTPKQLNDLPSAIQQYFNEIMKLPVLNPEKNFELAKQMAEGVPGAREQLIEGNLRLVIAEAKRYAGKDMEFEDIIQYGNLGLMKAVENYDYTYGVFFSTYAVFWIRQFILRSIVDYARPIKIPVYVTTDVKRIIKARKKFESEHGRLPTDDEIATITQMKLGHVKHLTSLYCEVISINTEGDSEMDGTLENTIASSDTETDPCAVMIAEERESVICGYLSHLTERERRIIILHFGLMGEKKMTLDEIGQELGLTRERVRQIESRAFNKLRSHPCIEELKLYLE